MAELRSAGSSPRTARFSTYCNFRVPGHPQQISPQRPEPRAILQPRSGMTWPGSCGSTRISVTCRRLRPPEKSDASARNSSSATRNIRAGRPTAVTVFRGTRLTPWRASCPASASVPALQATCWRPMDPMPTRPARACGSPDSMSSCGAQQTGRLPHSARVAKDRAVRILTLDASSLRALTIHLRTPHHAARAGYHREEARRKRRER